MSSKSYRGRFAPSPTGPPHFGTLVAAVGSYLEARVRRGEWLVRMEDLDRPRNVPGAADAILFSLEALGFEWDGPVLYQSGRDEAYREALEIIRARGLMFGCGCTRKEIADSIVNRRVAGELRYPGTCREGLPAGREPRSLRVQVPDAVIRFEDALQGTFEENLTESTGDFVLLRADGMFSYQLAVVVDDAWQGVTHVVRGADLLGSTARQIYLQGLLGCGQPEYLHLPVATNAAGEKLSKQTMAAPVEATNGAGLLVEALRFLGQCPPADLSRASVRDVWVWAVESWDPATIPRVLEQPAPGPASE